MDYPSDPAARLDPSTGKFTDGNPATDLPTSRDSADYQNMVFDSLINLIEGAGLTPDEEDLTLVLQAVTSLAGGRRLGEPFWHIGETPPNGAMEYAEQILNRSEYPELWSYISDPVNGMKLITQAEAASRPGCWHTGDGSTTFGAPVFFSDFIRVWDSTGLIDTGRVLGSFQTDELKSHNHSLGLRKSNNSYDSGSGNGPMTGSSLNSGDTGGTETRPRNTALMLCFWYQ
ncbi:hypothetical protein [Neptuniibacter marinus]|uniref:hypothetical protein n=1 Tax=Neptuniibacter marinus TaxID=1806670 RepID=UPI003B5B23E2